MVQWLTDGEQRAWRSFIGTWQVVEAATVAGHGEYGLSGADYAVLVSLSEAPDGRMRARDLGRAVHWDKSRVSKHVTRMATRGLVLREECPTDARGSFVVLTDAGRRAIEAAAPRHVEVVREVFIDRLSQEDLAALERIAAKVLDG